MKLGLALVGHPGLINRSIGHESQRGRAFASLPAAPASLLGLANPSAAELCGQVHRPQVQGWALEQNRRDVELGAGLAPIAETETPLADRCVATPTGEGFLYPFDAMPCRSVSGKQIVPALGATT